MVTRSKVRYARWSWAPLLMTFVLLVLSSDPLAAGEEPAPAEIWYDAEVTTVDSWVDPSSNGTRLMLDPSPDGSRVLVAGFGGPHDLRVMDRRGSTLGVLDLPGENATVKGVLWSWGAGYMCAWGRAEGNATDFLAMWDARTYEPAEEAFENATTTLPVVDAAYFMAEDAILAIAGRDANGTSRLLVMEVPTLGVRADHPWYANVTVMLMSTDTRDLLCLDELGGVTVVKSDFWNVGDRHQGFEARPTAVSFAYTQDDLPWILGYGNGSTRFWRCCPWTAAEEYTLGTGPVQGVCWIGPHINEFFVVAVPRGDGSAVTVHRSLYGRLDIHRVSGPMVTGAEVTMMIPDPALPGQVWVGLSDGTLALLNVTVTADLPPEVDVFSPEHNSDFWEETITFRGNLTDDHENITWVRVSVDDGVWQDVEWADGEWWFELDVTGMEPMQHNLTVMAFDGRTESQGWLTFFNIVQPRDDKDEMEHFWYWFTGCTAMVVVVAVVLYHALWRARPKIGGGDRGP